MTNPLGYTPPTDPFNTAALSATQTNLPTPPHDVEQLVQGQFNVVRDLLNIMGQQKTLPSWLGGGGQWYVVYGMLTSLSDIICAYNFGSDTDAIKKAFNAAYSVIANIRSHWGAGFVSPEDAHEMAQALNGMAGKSCFGAGSLPDCFAGQTAGSLYNLVDHDPRYLAHYTAYFANECISCVYKGNLQGLQAAMLIGASADSFYMDGGVPGPAPYGQGPKIPGVPNENLAGLFSVVANAAWAPLPNGLMARFIAGQNVPPSDVATACHYPEAFQAALLLPPTEWPAPPPQQKENA